MNIINFLNYLDSQKLFRIADKLQHNYAANNFNPKKIKKPQPAQQILDEIHNIKSQISDLEYNFEGDSDSTTTKVVLDGNQVEFKNNDN